MRNCLICMEKTVPNRKYCVDHYIKYGDKYPWEHELVTSQATPMQYETKTYRWANIASEWLVSQLRGTNGTH